VLSASAPLYGRAQVLFEVRPLGASHLRAAFRGRTAIDLVRLYTAWGGIPRYWELAVDAGRDVVEQLDALVLDPLGPLHDEPDRLLLEELPPAVELRPLLDVIGSGAHRVSEIGARLGRPATSLSRPLVRLQELGLLRRETPFGEEAAARPGELPPRPRRDGVGRALPVAPARARARGRRAGPVGARGSMVAREPARVGRGQPERERLEDPRR
jgi:hypothetical protein